MRRPVYIMAAAAALTCASTAFAAVSADEAKLLGSTLTPWGAEKAGNKEGTIPAYTGGSIAVPPTYDPKKPGVRPDPFANEKPLFSITASNAANYADKLSEGLKEMFKIYPGYRMDVYPTHRVANYPKYVLDNAAKNATQCKAVSDGLKLEGCYAGWPFPIPKTGAEVMWNRLLKFDSYSFASDDMTGVYMDKSGTRVVTGVGTMWIQYPIFDPKRTTPIGSDELYEMLRIDYSAPARKVGEKLVVMDSIDMVTQGRRAWSYIPGQRRVKLAPDLSYDTPTPTGGGVGTVDEAAVFYGALDRYDWKLVGKKELYLPYNDYKVNDPKVCPASVAMSTTSFINPDCMRWELHRVWVVKATLKPGFRHIYPHRTFYWDEDLPGIGIAENYDSSGKIYRVSHSLPISMYETQGHLTDQWVTYDLATGAYVRQMDVSGKGGWVTSDTKPKNFFNPEALAGEGLR